MLFDLRGRRRRVVQVVYLMLALLLGGGLVLFGIGGDVSGGLLNAFEGGGGQSGNQVLEDKVDRQEERLRATRQPEQKQRILQGLVRDYYALATSQRESGTSFPEDAKDDLRSGARFWKQYAEEAEEPNVDTARYALQIYDEGALNQPKEAQRAAAVIAEQQNDVVSYLNLVDVAARAGDSRTADLAAQKAVDLAPKAQRKQVKAQAEALKKPAEQQPSG